MRCVALESRYDGTPVGTLASDAYVVLVASRRSTLNEAAPFELSVQDAVSCAAAAVTSTTTAAITMARIAATWRREGMTGLPTPG